MHAHRIVDLVMISCKLHSCGCSIDSAVLRRCRESCFILRDVNSIKSTRPLHGSLHRMMCLPAVSGHGQSSHMFAIWQLWLLYYGRDCQGVAEAATPWFPGGLPLWLVVPVLRSCQSPIRIRLVNHLHLLLYLHTHQGRIKCWQCGYTM